MDMDMMSQIAVIAIILFAVTFLITEMRHEWRGFRRRRQIREMRHVLGARPWWGRR